jgi:hypothetical protein
MLRINHILMYFFKIPFRKPLFPNRTLSTKRCIFNPFPYSLILGWFVDMANRLNKVIRVMVRCVRHSTKGTVLEIRALLRNCKFRLIARKLNELGYPRCTSTACICKRFCICRFLFHY